MTIGLTTYRADTSVMVDGLTKGGVMIDVITAAQGTNGSKSYARVTSTSNLYYVFARAGAHTVSINLVGGQATVNWSYRVDAPQADSVIYVFARNMVVDEPFGVQILNDNDEILADQGYASPQYVGSVSFDTTANYRYSTPDGYTAFVHTSSAVNLRTTSDRMLLLAMIDVGTDDTWYSIAREFMLSGESSTVDLTVYTKAATYSLPSLHVYSLNNAVQAADNISFKVYDAIQNLTFDSSAETLSGRDSFMVNYPAYGATNTYALSFSSTPGAPIPAYSNASISSDNLWVNKYVGCAKRVGAQITVKSMYDAQIQNSGQNQYDYNVGTGVGRYMPVADLSGQSPVGTVVSPSGPTYSYPSFTTTQGTYSHSAPGDNVTFTVVVAGTPTPTVQWYFNGVSIAGATSTSYTRTMSLSDNGGTIMCKATNPLGTVGDAATTLAVDNNTAPVISSVSPNASVTPGTSVTISFTSTGTPTPTNTITGPHGSFTGNSWTFTAQQSDAGSYTLKADNGVGQAATASYQLTVADLPVFTTQPTNKSVSAGGSVTFTVAIATATSETHYQWYRNNVAIANTDTTNYTFTASLSDNGATYYCKATNAVGSTNSSSASLTVTQAPSAPTITSAPTATDMNQGSTTTLSVGVDGYPTPTVTWTVGGVQVGTGATCTASVSGTGSKTATCTVTNSSGTVTDTATFFIYSDFTVSVSPTSVTGTSGQTATITATCSGQNANLGMSWTGPNGYSVSTSGGNTLAMSVTIASNTTGTYTFSAGYQITGGLTHTKTATVNLDTGPATPVISSQPTNKTVSQNGSATFSVTASPATSYQWYRDGVAVSGATSSSVSANTGTVGTFTYYCIVYNSTASVQSSNATLTVTAPSTFSSYNNITATVYGNDMDAEFDFMTAGNSTSGNWGNGGGDGTLYSIYATGDFTPASGSYGFGTTYNFPSTGGIGYICGMIAANPNGTSRHVIYTMNYTITLNSTGATVSSGTITFDMLNSGIA